MDSTTEISMNYIDDSAIKDMVMKKMVQKYFPDIDVSLLNVGMIGFVSEQISNFTQDAFNTTSTLIKEAFPSRAQIPESIYSHAAVFQLGASFATPASCSFIIVLKESEIIDNFVYENGLYHFYLDKNTTINIKNSTDTQEKDKNIPYTLDYDVEIRAKKYMGNYIYSAQYVFDIDNSISKNIDPFIRIRKNMGGYIGIIVTAHQCVRETITEQIINNTEINFPVITFTFDDMLAGFDAFYKDPKTQEYVQLKKLVTYSAPIKTPFCYYRLSNNNEVSITFTTKDGYFQPEFNSEIKIIKYMTKGKLANFDVYNGTDIKIEPSEYGYEYNQGLSIAGMVNSSATGGSDMPDIEKLQALTVENYSTATALTSENDIKMFFNNYKYRYHDDIKVIKKRDDIYERLFSAFLIMRDTTGEYIYPTNTVFIKMTSNQVDIETNYNFLTIEPGHIFIYDNKSLDTVIMLNNVTIFDDAETLNNLENRYGFLYTNPFLIHITKKPNVIGLYKTTMSQICSMDFEESNNDIFAQFIIYQLKVERFLGTEKSYVFSTMATASSTELDQCITSFKTENDEKDESTSEETTYHPEINAMRLVLVFYINSVDFAYIEMDPILQDGEVYHFQTQITTDDYITSSNKFRAIGATQMATNTDYAYIPIENVPVKLYTLYRDETTIGAMNIFTQYDDSFKDYIVTNVYDCVDDPITFIQPMNLMRSTLTMTALADKTIQMKMSMMPLLKYDIPLDTDKFSYLMQSIQNHYQHLNECINTSLRNTTHIDMKFYNTYGRSKNFVIGDEEKLIDRVNTKISFVLYIANSADYAKLKTNIRIFIKNYIESVNEYGSNNLYISNLIREIELNFPDIDHLKFLGINDYDTDYQTVKNNSSNLDELTKEERRFYVPELLVTNLNDIILQIVEL